MKTTLIILLLPFTLFAQKHVHKEAVYQKAFSDTLTNNNTNNLIEVRLSDNTRCDIVTDSYAIEVDFANKWAESIGQSLHYSLMLNRKAGVLLILEGEKDVKYLSRLMVTAKRYNITVWTINKNFEYKRINKTKTR